MNPRRLYRSRTDRVLTGIAGGMAEYLEVDPTIVRILWVLATIFTGGLVLLLYIVLAFVIPVNPFQGGPVPAGAWAPGTPAGAGTPGQAGWTQPARRAGHDRSRRHVRYRLRHGLRGRRRPGLEPRLERRVRAVPVPPAPSGPAGPGSSSGPC